VTFLPATEIRMSLESEVEKIRAVRRGIGKQFDFDAAKLGEYYRKQEAELKSAARAKLESSGATARVKEMPES
jgi:hypothetical protein